MEASDASSDKQKRGVKRKIPAQDFAFCDLCQIGLNSKSQAEMHFSGKVHMSKVRSQEQVKTEANPGPSPSKKPAYDATKKPANDSVKNSYDSAERPVTNESTIKLTNEATIKPADDALLLQKTNESAKKTVNDITKKSPSDQSGVSLFCSVCNRSFNSIVQAQSHYSGKAHAFRLQMVNLQSFVHDDKNLSNPLTAQVLSNIVTNSGIAPTVPSTLGILPLPVSNLVLPPPPPLPTAAPLTPISTSKNSSLTPAQAAQVDIKLGSNIKTQVYRCDACSVTLNSDKQWEQHHRGLRHKIAIGKAKPPPPAQQGWEGVRFKKIAHTLIGISTSSGSNMGTYYCKDCDITVNSQKQLDQHLTSEKHKRVVNGELPGRGRGKGRGAPPGRGKTRPKGTTQQQTTPSTKGTVTTSTVLPLSSSFVLSNAKQIDVKPVTIHETVVRGRGLTRLPLMIPRAPIFGRGIPVGRGLIPTDILFGTPQLPPQQVWM